MNRTTHIRRNFLTDVRFLVGIALVVASVTGVWLVLSTARETTTVLQSNRTIVPGELVSSTDLRPVEVGLGAVGADYLTSEQLAVGAIANRTISAGELVHRSALTSATLARSTTIVLTSATGLPDTLARGDRVEVWAASPDPETRRYNQPYLLLPAATVASIAAPGGLIAQGAVTVELVINRAEVALVLAALGDESMLSIIPIGAGS